MNKWCSGMNSAKVYFAHEALREAAKREVVAATCQLVSVALCLTQCLHRASKTKPLCVPLALPRVL
jgi:hypothetical protein